MDFFFFSSRRRHTRWPRDWSSDVCSSDLYRMEDELREGYITIEGGHRVGLAGKVNTVDGSVKAIQRSEERRVGKECRAERWTEQEKERKRREKNEERESR